MAASKSQVKPAAKFSTSTGMRLATAVRAATTGQEGLPHSLHARLRDPFLVSSWLARTGLSVGIVFTMTVKPPAAWQGSPLP